MTRLPSIAGRHLLLHQLDTLHFAYWASRFVDHAVITELHFILQHHDQPGIYARTLFVDLSLGFNTISPILTTKLSQSTVSPIDIAIVYPI